MTQIGHTKWWHKVKTQSDEKSDETKCWYKVMTQIDDTNWCHKVKAMVDDTKDEKSDDTK